MVHKRFRGHYLVMAIFALAVFLVSTFTIFSTQASADPTFKLIASNTIQMSGYNTDCPNVTFTDSQGTYTGTCSPKNCVASRLTGNCPSNQTTWTIKNITVGGSNNCTAGNGNYCATFSGTPASINIAGNGIIPDLTASSGTSAANNSSSGSTGGNDCGGGALNWMICPVNWVFQRVGQSLTTFIDEQLTINTRQLFGTGCTSSTTGDSQCSTSQAYYKAWNTFRILGTSLIVIAGLVMVSSQALGFEIMDAYTVRKVLPRLLIAVIGMSLSWPLLSFFINFFNELGRGVQALIYAPFSGLPNHNELAAGFVNWGLLGFLALAAFTPYIAVVLPILGTGLLALLIGLVILIIRQVAVTLIVILAPFAIAAYVLPNTQRIWKIWYDNFLGLMFMFPIVTAFIAVGQVFAAVGASGNTVQQIVGMVAWFVPFFLIPLAFRMATGFISTIAGFVNDRSRGGFDRLRNARQGIMKQNHEDIMAGKRGLFGRNGRGGAAYQRAISAASFQHGAWGITRKQKAGWADYQRLHGEHTAGEMLEQGGARAFNDDDASKSALYAKSWDDAVKRYQYQTDAHGKFITDTSGNRKARTIRWKEFDANGNQVERERAVTEEEALTAMNRVQQAVGARFGTETMQLAAGRFRVGMTNTAYDGGEAGLEQLQYEAQHLIRDGATTTADVAGWMKGNRGRTDFNANSFGSTMAFIDGQQTARQQMAGAFNGADIRDILGGHTKSLDSMADQAAFNLNRVRAAALNGTPVSQAEEERAYADVANIHSALSSVSGQKGDMFAKSVMGQTLQGVTLQRADPSGATQYRRDAAGNIIYNSETGAPQQVPILQSYEPTVREYIDVLRSDATHHQYFHDRTREYSSAREAAGAGSGAAAAAPLDPGNGQP